jgi:hypothetical protein
MSRAHYRRPANNMSRRRVLAIAGAVGVGATTAGVAGLSLAGERTTAAPAGPLVISLRDAAKGTFDVFAGETRVTLTDRKFAAALLKAVVKG